MTKKLHIALLFGGNSSEHDVSKRSAHNIYDALDKEKYDVSLFMFTKDGILLGNEDSQKIFDGEPEDQVVAEAYQKMDMSSPLAPIMAWNEQKEIDFFFPVIHGNLGEDGTIQGYLQMVGIPYVSNNIYSSVICQDKVFTKQLLEHNDIPTIKYVWFFDNEYNKNKEELFKKIDKLEYPLIIKPATLGSSIGIVSVKRKEQLDTAINEVLKYDRKIIVEEQIENVLEYNISMLKTNDKLYISSIEEIETKLEYRDYVDKCNLENYLNGNIVRTTPAKISEKMSEEIIELGKKTINFLNNTGLSRIDFLYDSKKKKLYVDEINSIPSCFSHHLWEEANISYKELFTIMINDTIKNINKDSEMITTMDMDVLKDLKNSDIKEFK